MQSVEISGLKEVQKRLEGYPEAMKKARSEFFEEAGREMLSTVRRRIGGQGYVANVQEVYTAVRAKADTELRGYAAGYITNALENGHKVRGPSNHPKRKRKSRREEGRDRVAGIYMYHMTDADVVRRLTAEGAREIEKKAMAYLEGNG